MQSYDNALSNLPWHSFLDKQPTLGAGLFCMISCLAAVGLAFSFWGDRRPRTLAYSPAVVVVTLASVGTTAVWLTLRT